MTGFSRDSINNLGGDSLSDFQTIIYYSDFRGELAQKADELTW